MTKLNLDSISNIKDVGKRADTIVRMIEACAPDDPPLLSDLLARVNDVGGVLLQVLGEHQQNKIMNSGQQIKWKIKVLRDEWGNPPAPGDEVIRLVQRKLLDSNKLPIQPDDLSVSMVDGSYEDRFFDKIVFPVDEKGCIECNFNAAVSFLNLYGLHAHTKKPLTMKPEHSKEPVDAPNGTKIHVWYRKYQEVDKAGYEKLSKCPARKGPRRGLDPVEESKTK